MGKTKGKKKQRIIVNPLEKMLAGGLDDLLGFSSAEKKQEHRTGDLKEGQELNLKDLQEEKQSIDEERIDIEPGINYSREILQVEERAVGSESHELEMQLKEIMGEIKKLIDSSKELQVQFKDIAIEQYVIKPGKYHRTFFSWLLSLIRTARQKVEDSGAWLAAIQSKKKSRGYGAMAKKHGTSFSLSNERNVATQVG